MLSRSEIECNQGVNLERCTCTCEPYPRKGVCFECIAYRRKYGELSGSQFPSQVGRTYDRSVARVVATFGSGGSIGVRTEKVHDA